MKESLGSSERVWHGKKLEKGRLSGSNLMFSAPGVDQCVFLNSG